jgi:hypothetical protein
MQRSTALSVFLLAGISRTRLRRLHNEGNVIKEERVNLVGRRQHNNKKCNCQWGRLSGAASRVRGRRCQIPHPRLIENNSGQQFITKVTSVPGRPIKLVRDIHTSITLSRYVGNMEKQRNERNRMVLLFPAVKT